MLKGLPILKEVGMNIFFMALWHFACFWLCTHLDHSYFDSSKQQYKARRWEQHGKWYQENLNIKKWKDILPQHIGKDGFSKKSFAQASIDYIDEFILETCRGEWDHTRNCIYGGISLAISSPAVGVVFLLLTLLVNLPFIAIQRYNRFRLQALRAKILKKNKKHAE